MLIDKYGSNLENVVVSFTPNHILLIDQLYKDENGEIRVVCSDQTSLYGNAETATAEQKNYSLIEFKSNYIGGKKSIVGSVLIGK